MINQPTPDVTDEDVNRVVTRDFAEDDNTIVSALLKEYGAESWHQEPTRVRLAALKLADGDVGRLTAELENAKNDYRDILGSAEYPSYMDHYDKDVTDFEKQQIIESDWRQYQTWLNK